MRYLFAAITTLAWGLWFGGVMALFLFVVRLNVTFAPPRREIFSEAASASFFMFERYQLVVGAVALVGALGWRIASPGVSRTLLFCFLGLAAGASIMESKFITPKIEAIRQDWIHLKAIEQPITVDSQLRFGKLHGLSMTVYVSEAAFLLIAGALLPLVLRPTTPGAELSDAPGHSK